MLHFRGLVTCFKTNTDGELLAICLSNGGGQLLVICCLAIKVAGTGFLATLSMSFDGSSTTTLYQLTQQINGMTLYCLMSNYWKTSYSFFSI